VTGEDFGILGLTLRIAGASTLAIFPIGLATGWALARWKGPGRAFVETALSLPLVLPPTAVGLLLLELLRRSGPLGRVLDRRGIDVLFTWKAVALATAVMSFPLLVRPIRAAFEEIDPRLLGLARSLGRRPLNVFATVAIPIAWRGILTGVVLAFSRALGEFGATILVAGNIPGRTQTLALAIFHRTQIGQDRAAMRLVALTVLLAFLAIWVSELLSRHRERQALA
jgi:molybdate transport system permease protein